VVCWFADLEESQAEGEHGPGRRKAAVRDPGAAVAAMQPDRKDQQTEAEGPDGLVGVAVAHWEEELQASMG